MRVFQLIMASISALLIFSTLICGLWIRFAGKAVTDRASSIQFHTTIGIATAVFVIITLVTVFIRK